MENFVKKQISRVAKNTLIVLLIPFLILGFFTGKQMFEGRFNPKKVNSVEDISINKYIDLSSVMIYDTGYTYLDDNIVTGKYYLIDFDNHYLLALMPKDITETSASFEVKGYTRDLDSIDNQVYNALIYDLAEDWEVSVEEVKLDVVGGFILESKNTINTFFILATLTTIFGLLSLWQFFIMIEPKNSKTYKRLAKNEEDIDSLLDNVDREIDGNHLHLDTKQVKIMPTYIINSTGFSFNIYKTNELMWVYKVITTHRTNGIKTGTSYSVMFKFSDKRMFQMPAKNEANVDNIIQDLMTKISGVFYGFTPELNTLYMKQFNEFIVQWEVYKREKNHEHENE